MSWQKIAVKSDIPENEVIMIEASGTPVALYNINGKIYATHDICTHKFAHLSEGYIEGEYIECPLHQGLFHIPTGKASEGPVEENLCTFPVKEENEDIYVDLSSSAQKNKRNHRTRNC